MQLRAESWDYRTLDLADSGQKLGNLVILVENVPDIDMTLKDTILSQLLIILSTKGIIWCTISMSSTYMLEAAPSERGSFLPLR